MATATIAAVIWTPWSGSWHGTRRTGWPWPRRRRRRTTSRPAARWPGAISSWTAPRACITPGRPSGPGGSWTARSPFSICPSSSGSVSGPGTSSTAPGCTTPRPPTHWRRSRPVGTSPTGTIWKRTRRACGARWAISMRCRTPWSCLRIITARPGRSSSGGAGGRMPPHCTATSGKSIRMKGRSRRRSPNTSAPWSLPARAGIH